MTQFISEIDVSVNEADEQNLQCQGFEKINVDLNKGVGGEFIYIWFKRGPVPITKIQFTFNHFMAVGLIEAGYTKIDRDLNAGAGGDLIYLWFKRGSGEFDTPIEHLEVTVDAEGEAGMFENDWERLACDLNRGCSGNYVHLWVKREKKTYICDVTATDSYKGDANLFKDGYIRLDENTNRGAGGSPVFTWYRQTPDQQRALNDLRVSVNDKEYQALLEQKYTVVNVNLNEKSGGDAVFLWYKKYLPVKGLTLLLNCEAVKVYKTSEAIVIEKNLNASTTGNPEFLCFYQ